MVESLLHILGWTIKIGDFQLSVEQILAAPIGVLLAYLLLRALSYFLLRFFQRRGINPDALQVVRRVLHILVILIVILVGLRLLAIPLTAFAFISGAIAIGLGFGAQNVINNFISGWIVIWERPIRINDFIEVSGVQGTVLEINTRSTRLRRPDGIHLIIPNSKLLEENVINWTLVDRLLRCVVRVSVAYESPVQTVEQIILAVVTEHEAILATPEPEVILEDLGDSALVFDVYFWVDLGGNLPARMIRSHVRKGILDRFDSEGITIPFPQRSIHLIDGTDDTER